MPRASEAPQKKNYVHQSFPAWRHHATKESKLVQNARQSAEETPDEGGWVDDPALLPKPVDAAGDASAVAPELSASTLREAFNVNWDKLMAEHRDLQNKHFQLGQELDAAQGEAGALRTANAALKSELEALKAPPKASTQFQKKAPVVITADAPATE